MKPNRRLCQLEKGGILDERMHQNAFRKKQFEESELIKKQKHQSKQLDHHLHFQNSPKHKQLNSRLGDPIFLKGSRKPLSRLKSNTGSLDAIENIKVN